MPGGGEAEVTFNSLAYTLPSVVIWYPTNVNTQFGGVKLTAGGSGYSDTVPYQVRIKAHPRGPSGLPSIGSIGVVGTTSFVCEFYTGANPNSPVNQFTTGMKYPIQEVRVVNAGSGYTGRPKLRITEATQ
jgi:hypothetical protein